MAYSGGKEISNSFTLELNNLNGASEEEVNLFNLGGELDEPILTPKSVNYIFQNFTILYFIIYNYTIIISMF